ncbi:MAG: Cadherin, partial [Rhodospirillales bacterium]|nr:Cadherin [Rhodospirillales bacterium]
GDTNQIPFIVRQDELRTDGTRSDILLQTSDTTWQAYNGWGGNNGQIAGNFYGGFDQPGAVADPGLNQDRSYAVSYNRPITTRDGGGAASGAQDYLFGADYAAIHWLEQNGYDVSYISGVDTDRLGADYLKAHKAFISVGHDEYWSGPQRDNVEAARDAGVNLLFWSGNEVYWKTRWEPSISEGGTAYRTLVSYKETWANRDPNAPPEAYANIDPSNEWTGTWRDLRFANSIDANGNLIARGAEPENALTGQLFGPDGTGEFGGALDIPAPFAGLRVWRDTGVPSGGQLDLAPGIVGYEWNTSPEDEYRPEGLIKLSETTIPWSGILVDQGNTTAPGTATHNLSLYRAESGALVFGAGTVFWTWALSNEHDNAPYSAQIEGRTIQQFTVNMFADMGIQPAVADAILASQSLVRASASNDSTPASAGLVDLPSTISARQTLTITGTATDVDGNAATPDGVVAAVEVSVDGGATWRLAEGTTNWSYAWRPTVEGTYNIRARAIDDSLNISPLGVSQDTVTVTAAATPPTVSLFESAPITPTTSNDGQAIELGMQFSVGEPGTITQLKYWRAATDAGDSDVRDGHLWGQDGTLLATATFNSAAGQSGWQIATLAAPVAVAPGVEYTVSYRTANNYVATNGFFAPANEVAFDGLDNNAFTDPFGKISAPQDEAGDGNGVYRYGADAVMPTDTFQSSNYWVDITFDPAEGGGTNQPPVFNAPFAFTVAENTTAVATLNVSDPDGTAITYGITGPDAARFTVNPATRALAFTTAPDFEAPADVGGNNIYDLVISASDGIADPVARAITVTVTDATETVPTGSRLFGPAEVPANFVGDDRTNYELGTKFTATRDGQATVLQYYRGIADADDTDVRTMTLWNGSGQALGSVSITAAPNQTGWQTGTLATPIVLTANATYVVSYSFVSDNGVGATESYAATGNYFAAARPGPDGVLIGPASGTSGGNGVFADGAPSTFPTASFNATNYWTDVLFTPGSTPPVNTPPAFTSPAIFVADENQTLVGNVTATDPNAGQTLTYGIAGGVDAALFQIGATNGVLRFLFPQDYEAGDTVFNVNVTVSASDGVAPAVTQELTVNLADVNEGVAGSTSFTGSSLTAEYIFGATPTTLFPGAGATQTATVGAGIEFPNLPSADATNVGNGPFGLAAADVAQQTIRIDFPLDSGQFSGFLAFASVADKPFNGVRIADAANGLPTILGASIIGQQGFTNASGALQPLTAADLTVTADGIFLNVAGKGRLVDVDSTVAGAQPTNITLLVDLNDAPVIQGGATASVLVAENTTAVAALAATDADVGQTAAFSIAGGEDAALFQLSGSQLRFIVAPNFEALPSDGLVDGYQVIVQAADAFGGVDTQAITVVVTDVSEGSVAAPTDADLAPDAVGENAAAGTVVGITAQATDGDAGDTVSYSLTDNAGGQFAINAATGVVTVAPGAVLDREAAAAHLITVRATSSDTSSADANFTIALGDVDEFNVTAPVDGNASTNTVPENAAVGAMVGITAQAADADATTNAVAYSLVENASGRFAINAATGVVTVAGALDFETVPTPSITVRATSADGSTADSAFGIAVTDVDESAPPGTANFGSGPDSLVLKISQDAYLGSAQYDIAVDGLKINSTPITAAALHSSGLFDTVTVLGNWTGNHAVSVSFLNDVWGGTAATDRNLYVDGITFKDDAAATPSVVSSTTTALTQAGTAGFNFTDGVASAPLVGSSDFIF